MQIRKMRDHIDQRPIDMTGKSLLCDWNWKNAEISWELLYYITLCCKGKQESKCWGLTCSLKADEISWVYYKQKEDKSRETKQKIDELSPEMVLKPWDQSEKVRETIRWEWFVERYVWFLSEREKEWCIVKVVMMMISGVARICCEEWQSWKWGHGALTAYFRAGCSSGSMTNSFVTNVVLIERAVSCRHLQQPILQTTQYLDSSLSDFLQSELKWNYRCLISLSPL